MKKKSFASTECSIARALGQVGDGWSLLIVRDCTQGARRFDEFQTSLGIARNILADRLESLVEDGVLERFPLEDRVNTDGYRLTGKGEELYTVMVALQQWGDKWLAGDCQQPIDLVEDATGEPIETLRVRNKTGRPLSFRDVRYAPGPGASEIISRVVKDRNQRVLGESEQH